MNKKIILSISLLFTLTLSFANCNQSPQSKETEETSDINETIAEESPIEVPQLPAYPLGVVALMESYPDFIKGYENDSIIFSDGSRMIYDDGVERSFNDMLDNSSLKDMFYSVYVGTDSVPGYLMDAGRSRNEALFKRMYGSSASEVQKNMEKVNWFGQSMQFTSRNGAAAQLRKVAEELAEHPELKKYLKSAGTFYWRPVRGANRLSAHSYGIAIDIGTEYSDYWLWRNPGAKETSKIKHSNRMPKEVVEIFEKHGFIWGGGWYHFDTMHFEYRPEILRYKELVASGS